MVSGQRDLERAAWVCIRREPDYEVQSLRTLRAKGEQRPAQGRGNR
jgi:hypothetical protein